VQQEKAAHPMLVRSVGSSIAVSDEHEKHTRIGSTFKLVGNAIEVSLVQSEKAAAPMLESPGGKSTIVSKMQQEKASACICVILAGNSILRSAAQSAKAASLTHVSPSGNSMVASDVHSEKAPLQMLSSPFGSVILSKDAPQKPPRLIASISCLSRASDVASKRYLSAPASRPRQPASNSGNTSCISRSCGML